MKESNFQTIWHNYLVHNPLPQPEVHELKLVKRNVFVFDAVKDHQILGLKCAETGLFHKISDSPIYAGMKSRFTAQKPFDCLWLTGIKGFVIICFYEPRKYKKVFKIGIDQFLKIKENHPRKSIRLSELELLIKPINL